MLNSFEQAVKFMITNGILEDFKTRIRAVNKETKLQKWHNTAEFNAFIERFE
jgi:hypothetical protein